WNRRVVLMLPVEVNRGFAGSKSSAEASGLVPSYPPTIRTFGLAHAAADRSQSSVAACTVRALLMLAVEVKGCLTGPKSSADESAAEEICGGPLESPPVMSTWPLLSKVAVWFPRPS